MATRKIPDNVRPVWRCTINGKTYSYPSGATMDVPDEVANLIDNINRASDYPPAPYIPGLPAIGDNDDGKAVIVSGKQYVLGTGGGGGGGSDLPEVTDEDDGKVLMVSGGEWKDEALPSDNVFVPFTVTVDQGGAHATTTADFADTVSAIAEGKNILAKVYLSGMVFCGGLTTIYPETDPLALSFCVVANTANPGAAPTPQLMKISWSAEGATAEIANLAVAT